LKVGRKVETMAENLAEETDGQRVALWAASRAVSLVVYLVARLERTMAAKMVVC
jgi:hypothetical protein